MRKSFQQKGMVSRWLLRVVRKGKPATGETGYLLDALQGGSIGTADHGTIFLRRPQQPEGRAMEQERQ